MNAGPVASAEDRVLTLAADAALLPGGWARNVVFVVGDDGLIASIAPNADTAGLEHAAGPVVPAMPNLHSHAFQRALAGRTGTDVAIA